MATIDPVWTTRFDTTSTTTYPPNWITPILTWPGTSVIPSFGSMMPVIPRAPVDPDAFLQHSLQLIEINARLVGLEELVRRMLKLQKQLDPFAPVEIILPGEA